MKILIELLSITGFGVCFGLFFMLVIRYIEWGSTKVFTVGKIRFDHFKGLYQTNPKGWSLYNGHVAYMGDDSWEEHGFYFGFVDYLKYQNWKDKIDEQKEKEKNNKALRACIESWNRDLEEYRLKIENKELCEKCRLNGICDRACPDVLNGGNK